MIDLKDKKMIRKSCLFSRNQLTQKEVLEKSEAIVKRLENEGVYQKAQKVLFYHSHQNEVYTHQAIQRAMDSKEVYLPHLTSDNQMEVFLCKDLKNLQLNAYGIAEPQEKNEAEEIELDLIIVPGVAFDLKGHRIGMGKGYYDRFLAHRRDTLKIGLAYETQIFDELPKDPYDESVNLIITEKRVIKC